MAAPAAGVCPICGAPADPAVKPFCSRRCADIDLSRWLNGAYAIPADAADGMDVLAVETATRKAVNFVRQGGGPYFMEYRTYRFRAHSMYDAELYRTKDEVTQWKLRDPITSFAQHLRTQGLLHDADVEKMETAIAVEIAEAVAFAEAGEWEPIEDLTRDVYTPVNSSQRLAKTDS